MIKRVLALMACLALVSIMPSLRADLHPRTLRAVPPPDSIASLANNPECSTHVTRGFFRRFLRLGQRFDQLPPELEKHARETRVGLYKKSDGKGGYTLCDDGGSCEGTATTTNGTILFWQLIAPEFLVVTDENGAGFTLYMKSPQPVDLPVAVEAKTNADGVIELTAPVRVDTPFQPENLTVDQRAALATFRALAGKRREAEYDDLLRSDAFPVFDYTITRKQLIELLGQPTRTDDSGLFYALGGAEDNEATIHVRFRGDIVSPMESTFLAY